MIERRSDLNAMFADRAVGAAIDAGAGTLKLREATVS